jgi:hypothetical protein
MHESQALVAVTTKFSTVSPKFLDPEYDLAPCYPSSAYNFEMAPIFLVNLCTSALNLKEGLSNNIQISAVFEISHIVCNFLCLQKQMLVTF